MSKLNHFICPNCGHDFYENGAYATCDGCQTLFYVSASKTCQPRANNIVLTTNPIQAGTGTTYGY